MRGEEEEKKKKKRHEKNNAASLSTLPQTPITVSSLGRHRRDLLLDDLLVHLADLESADGLEQARAVGGPGERRVLEHLLRDLAIELGRRLRQVRLDVDELLEFVEGAVHLEDGDLLAVVGVGAVVVVVVVIFFEEEREKVSYEEEFSSLTL
jgi:hypothetical protein